jgi:hypothetical protein
VVAVPVEKIIELAQKAGFETELKVASILASARWRVDQSVYYIDKDEKQGRELDLYAYRVFHQKDAEKPEIHCLVSFLYRSKKDVRAIYFFSRVEFGTLSRAAASPSCTGGITSTVTSLIFAILRSVPLEKQSGSLAPTLRLRMAGLSKLEAASCLL